MSLFGGGGTGTFGASQAQTSSAFGTAAPFGGGGFGQQNAFGSQQRGGTAFGAAAPAQGAFGAGSPSPAFGSGTSTFGAGGTGFGAQQTSSVFGSQATPAFGSSTPAPFGTTQTSAFGASTSTPPFGATASPASPPAFGASTSTFGQQPTQTPSLFGSSTATAPGSTFGAAAAPTAAPFGAATAGFGMAAAGQQRGTSGHQFQPTQQMENNGLMYYQSISAQEQYKGKSFEELRFEDYSQNVKGSASAPATAQGSSPGFFGSSTGFGAATSAPAPFGAGATPSPLGGGMGFGTVSTGAPAFGAGSSSPFGAGASTSTAFGAGATGGAFGSAASNPFGAKPAASNPFGGGAATSAFGSTTAGAFGAQPAAGGAFGQPAAGTPAFGGTSSFSFGGTSQPQQGGLLGTAATPAFGPASSSPFGAATPAFGGASPGFGQAQPGASAFGQPAASPAGTGSLFGTPAPAGGAFGGSPGGGLFGGGGASAFGTQPDKASPFGAPAAGTSLFGGGATSSPFGGFGTPTASTPGALGAGSLFGGGFGVAQPAAAGAGVMGGAAVPGAAGPQVLQVPQQPPPSLTISPYGSLGKPMEAKGLGALPVGKAAAQAGPVRVRNVVPHAIAMRAPRRSVGSSRPRRSSLSAVGALSPVVAAGAGGGRSPAAGSVSPLAAADASPSPVAAANIFAGGVGSSRKLVISHDLPSVTGTPSASPLAVPQAATPGSSTAKLTGGRGASTTPTDPLPAQGPAGSYDKDGRTENGEQSGAETDDAALAVLLPKMKRHDYYMKPSLHQLAETAKREGSHALAQVEGLVVGRHNCGSVEWLEPVDVRRLDLDSIVELSNGSVAVYPEEDEASASGGASAAAALPAPGEGLNKPAKVSLHGCWPKDRRTKERLHALHDVQKFEQKLRSTCAKQGAQFLGYDSVKGVWMFQVEHFSRYGLPDDSEEEVEEGGVPSPRRGRGRGGRRRVVLRRGALKGPGGRAARQRPGSPLPPAWPGSSPGKRPGAGKQAAAGQGTDGSSGEEEGGAAPLGLLSKRKRSRFRAGAKRLGAGGGLGEEEEEEEEMEGEEEMEEDDVRGRGEAEEAWDGSTPQAEGRMVLDSKPRSGGAAAELGDDDAEDTAEAAVGAVWGADDGDAVDMASSPLPQHMLPKILQLPPDVLLHTQQTLLHPAASKPGLPPSDAGARQERGLHQHSWLQNQLSPLRLPGSLAAQDSGPPSLPAPQPWPLALQDSDSGVRARAGTAAEQAKGPAKHVAVLHSSCLSDAGLMLGRSFRAGWAPDGRLVTFGGAQGCLLNTRIRIRQLALGKPVSSEEKPARPAAEDTGGEAALQKHLAASSSRALDALLSVHMRWSPALPPAATPAAATAELPFPRRMLLCSRRRQLAALREELLVADDRVMQELLQAREGEGQHQDAVRRAAHAQLVALRHRMYAWSLLHELWCFIPGEAGCAQAAEVSELTGEVPMEAAHGEARAGDGRAAAAEAERALPNMEKAAEFERRARASHWLKLRCTHAVRSCVAEEKSQGLLRVLAQLLTGHQLQGAAAAAMRLGDVRLATLICSAGRRQLREGLQQQLQQWRQQGILPSEAYKGEGGVLPAGHQALIDRLRWSIYELLAGNAVPLLQLPLTSRLDWKRSLGLYLWYSHSSMDRLSDALATYEQAVAEGVATPPTPAFSAEAAPELPRQAEGPLPAAAQAPPLHDVHFELLRLGAGVFRTGQDGLQRLLRPLGCSGDPLDHSLPWALLTLLQAVCGKGFFYEADAETGLVRAGREVELACDTTMGLVAQLLTLQAAPQPSTRWAVYVALSLPDHVGALNPSLRTHAVREVLAMTAPSWALLQCEPSTSSAHERWVLPKMAESAEERFLREELGIPARELARAKGLWAQYNGNHRMHLLCLLQSEQMQQAHDVLTQHLAAFLYLTGLENQLCAVLDVLFPHAATICGWSEGGGLFADFLSTIGRYQRGSAAAGADWFNLTERMRTQRGRLRAAAASCELSRAQAQQLQALAGMEAELCLAARSEAAACAASAASLLEVQAQAVSSSHNLPGPDRTCCLVTAAAALSAVAA